MQDLEEQVIQEKGRSQTDFLSACQAALHTSPAKLKGVLVASYHILLGQTPTSHPFTLSQGASAAEQLSAPAAPPMPAPKQSPRSKRWHPSPDPVGSNPWVGPCPRQPQKDPQLQTVRSPTLEQGTQAELLRNIQPGH